MAFTKYDSFYLALSEQLTQVLERMGIPSLASDFYPLFSTPPQEEMGHLALPLFQLAKAQKKNPAQLAKELEGQWENKLPWIAKAQAFGPYLNFFFNHEQLATLFIPSVLNQDFFQTKLTENSPKTMIEFSQPNTHKELHVGHMRNLCYGDALIRLNRYAGVNIVSSTFPGDVGTHVAKCLWYFKTHYQGDVPKTRKGAWLGSLYTLGNNKLEDERGTPQEEINRRDLTLILAQLERKEGEYYDLWKETRQWSVELMKEVYAWADVTFDVWYWESEVDSASVKLARELFEQGLLIQSEGAIGADLTDYKLGFCLMIKTDGNGLYATKDVELARRKFQEHKIEKSLYVVDKRQELHFKQVFKVLELMGFPHAKDCTHLQYDFVELPDGAMSSRKGNIVPLQKLIDEMVSMIKTQYLSRYDGQWSTEDIEKTAQMVAKGAIKFGMTRIDPNKKIVFEMSEWLKLDGESGPYIQYVHARIKSMLIKIAPGLTTTADFSKLQKKEELSLLRQMLGLNHVVQSACEQNRPSMLTAYLYDLAKSFNGFYAECPLTSSEPGLKEARFALSQATALILHQGLALLGIEAPERM